LVILSLPNSPPLSTASVTTGTLSMSSGSLCCLPFTSCRYFDDYLPILYHGLDLELHRSESCYSFLPGLLDRLRSPRKAALFRRCNCCLSARVDLTAKRARQRLRIQRAHGSAHPDRADCPGAAALKSASIVLNWFFPHLPHSSGYRMGC